MCRDCQRAQEQVKRMSSPKAFIRCECGEIHTRGEKVRKPWKPLSEEASIKKEVRRITNILYPRARRVSGSFGG